jgi:hypothetical protein
MVTFIQGSWLEMNKERSHIAQILLLRYSNPYFGKAPKKTPSHFPSSMKSIDSV